MQRTAPSVPDLRFQSIQRVRVSDRVAREILRLIAAGELVPGERLPGERQLAELMEVSRASVRAALQQLKAQGFVRAVRGGGTRIVASTDPLDVGLTELIRASAANLADLAEIRANLEIWAVRRAAERGGDGRLPEIARILEAMADPERPAACRAEDDHAYHLAIARASGSAVYRHLMSVLGEILEKMFDHSRNRHYPTERDDRCLLDQHRAIYRAIEAGDAEAAGQAMREHLEAAQAGFRNPPAESEAADLQPLPRRRSAGGRGA
ncbi:MAG: FadR/GntR family transcriptional regulator [Tistlia sp.]|uniref:FadR/GntR family transcriptional regulator n=1 Tax=Tistlia sp. TaxID=3057121 RepID=UPI0034A1683B